MADETLALVDTDVFGAVFVDPDGAIRRGLPVDSWRAQLGGIRVLISFQTRAEVLAGLRASNWGEQRRALAIALVDSTPTVPADAAVIESYIALLVDCRRAGHALHAKIHNADRWVAASALAKGLPLKSGDGIYRGAPGLRLLGETIDG
jgi:predicted nucleic acid-binding protein